MARLTALQRRKLIDAMLSELDAESLRFDCGHGNDLRREIHIAFDNTLESDYTLEAVANLWEKMTLAFQDEIENLALGDYDFRSDMKD